MKKRFGRNNKERGREMQYQAKERGREMQYQAKERAVY